MLPASLHPRLIAVAAAAAAVWSAYALQRHLRRDRLVADTPASRIRSAAQGYVKLSGRTQPAGPAPTAAPLSERPCVWWDFKICHEERDAKGNTRWETVERGSSVELFALVDEDGAQCLVGPVRAEVTPTISNTWYGSTARPSGALPATSKFLNYGEWRYTERLLGVGEQVCVLGELRSHSETGDLNAATAEKLRRWKQDPQALLARFDKNRDGHIDSDEWDAARAAAATEAQQELLNSNISRTSVITEPTNGEPFLVAPLTQSQLVRREQLYAVLFFMLGIASLFVSVWTWEHS
jgi:E3 Ubiquitin ligase